MPNIWLPNKSAQFLFFLFFLFVWTKTFYFTFKLNKFELENPNFDYEMTNYD